jgi:hypothetical protein
MVLIAVALGLLGAGGALFGATSDFDMKIGPAAAGIGVPPAGGSGDVDMQALLTTRVDAVQGWSFGVMLDTDAMTADTAKITMVAKSDGVLHLKSGAKADFSTTSIYAAGDLENKVNDCDPVPAAGTPPTIVCDNVDAVAFTQGVVIDFMQGPANVLNVTTDFPMVAFTVNATGQPDDTCDVIFTSGVGSPPVATVVVLGGGSFAPEVQAKATITLTKQECKPPTQYTIAIADAEGAADALVTSMVSLSFDSDPANANTNQIQGWSYGICIGDTAKLEVVDATSAGTDSATVKGGAPAQFDSINKYPEGVTHGIVIDFMAQVKLPPQNDWTDLVVTYKVKMTTDGDKTDVHPCNKALGTPPVANVMVINGGSIQANEFEGSPDLIADPAVGCCDPAVCNKPAWISFAPGDRVIAGNANGDARLDIADGIYILSFLFRGGPPPSCEKAADANADCALDASDAVYIIYYLLLDGPPSPYGTGCQLIPSGACTALTCATPGC